MELPQGDKVSYWSYQLETGHAHASLFDAQPVLCKSRLIIFFVLAVLVVLFKIQGVSSEIVEGLVQESGVLLHRSR